MVLGGCMVITEAAGKAGYARVDGEGVRQRWKHPDGATLYDVAAAIGPGLARAAIGGVISIGRCQQLLVADIGDRCRRGDGSCVGARACSSRTCAARRAPPGSAPSPDAP